jgi:prepilin-type N-terminal cleavage/methylation domain-containing protein
LRALAFTGAPPYKVSMRAQRGFTLTELLVATIVFLIGFVSVFALFLGGMRMRKLAEDTTRASLAASCLIDEIRIDAGGGGTGIPFAPKQYQGDGFAPFVEGDDPDEEGTLDGTALDLPLFPYKPIPGVWYRVLKATDLQGEPENAQTTVLKLDLLVVPFGSADTRLTLADLDRRLGLFTPAERRDAKADEFSARVVQRGIGFRFVAVVTRRPSWLR